MHVDLLQDNGTVRKVPVDHRCGGHLWHVPLELDYLGTKDPLVVRVGFGKADHALHTLPKARAVDEVDAKVLVGRHGPLGKVSVGVDQPRHYEPVAIVAHDGLRPHERSKVEFVPAGDYLVAGNRDTAGKRHAPVAREHVA